MVVYHYDMVGIYDTMCLLLVHITFSFVLSGNVRYTYKVEYDMIE